MLRAERIVFLETEPESEFDRARLLALTRHRDVGEPPRPTC